jgi:hypothetical protein
MKKKKNAICNMKKPNFFTALFWDAPLASYFKDDLYSLRRCSYDIFNHSK